MENNRIVYVDMDNTLCDFTSAYMAVKAQYPDVQYPQSMENFFIKLEPLKAAIETYRWLDQQDGLAVYILTAPSVWNPLSYTEKRLWVGEYFDIDIAHKLILSPDKSLLKGDYLIDDIVAGKGQEGFEGRLIHFGSDAFPDWQSVKHYFEQHVLALR